jgi:hypothetical protein
MYPHPLPGALGKFCTTCLHRRAHLHALCMPLQLHMALHGCVLLLEGRCKHRQTGLRTGKTHSFFDHTPEPKGQVVRPTLLSKSARQYSGPYCLSASMSCTTSSRPPSFAR